MMSGTTIRIPRRRSGDSAHARRDTRHQELSRQGLRGDQADRQGRDRGRERPDRAGLRCGAIRLHHWQRRVGGECFASVRGPGQVYAEGLRESEAATGSEPDGQHALADGRGQRHQLRPDLSRAAQEPGEPGRRAAGDLGVGQQPEHRQGGRVGQRQWHDFRGDYRVRRRQASRDFAPGPACAGGRHGDRRVVAPGRVSLGDRRSVQTILSAA